MRERMIKHPGKERGDKLKLANGLDELFPFVLFFRHGVPLSYPIISDDSPRVENCSDV